MYPCYNLPQRYYVRYTHPKVYFLYYSAVFILSHIKSNVINSYVVVQGGIKYPMYEFR